MAHVSVADLPDAKFHHLMISGLLSIYLSDRKVSRQKDVRAIAVKLLALGGAETFFFTCTAGLSQAVLISGYFTPSIGALFPLAVQYGRSSPNFKNLTVITNE